ncbi:MAG: hypothetical protein QXK29_03420 [Candidatus Bathyarchaeia archaeon]
MAALKHKRNHTPKGNSIRGVEWLQLKALLCFGCFWRLICNGEEQWHD